MSAIVAAVLLAIAAFVALASAVGVWVMKSPLQKLHYGAPPATVSAVCVVIAIGLRDSHPSATFKAAYVALVLVAMNAIAATATARAAFVRLNRRWPPNKGDVEELP